MKHLNIVLLAMLVAIFLGSCSEDEKPEMEKDEICMTDFCIEGEWNWIQSYGSVVGALITPETEMLERKLIIDDALYREFINDSLILEIEYEFTKSDEITFSEDSLVLKLGTVKWYGVSQRDNNLNLIEPCFDCWTHTYSRE